MCTGIEIASLVLGGLSTVGQMAQNRAAQKNAERQAAARNRVLGNFLEKNDQLAQEARARFEDRLGQEGDARTQTDDLATKREETTTDLIDRASAAAPIPLGGNVPKVVANEAAAAQGEASERSRRNAENLAATRSFGDLIFNKGLATEAAGRDIGQINSFAQANARLLPSQQDLAQHRAASKGDGLLGLFGDVAGAAGGLGTAALGSGALDGVFRRSAPQFSPIPTPKPLIR